MNQELEAGVDKLLGGVPHTDLMFYHRFCLNTPARKDTQSRCEECAQKGRQPAAKDAGPGEEATKQELPCLPFYFSFPCSCAHWQALNSERYPDLPTLLSQVVCEITLLL